MEAAYGDTRVTTEEGDLVMSVWETAVIVTVSPVIGSVDGAV